MQRLWSIRVYHRFIISLDSHWSSEIHVLYACSYSKHSVIHLQCALDVLWNAVLWAIALLFCRLFEPAHCKPCNWHAKQLLQEVRGEAHPHPSLILSQSQRTRSFRSWTTLLVLWFNRILRLVYNRWMEVHALCSFIRYFLAVIKSGCCSRCFSNCYNRRC